MTHLPIRAVLFDMGGTLEDVSYDDDLRLRAACEFRELLLREGLDTGLDVSGLLCLIQSKMNKYQTWREASEMEAPPETLWTDYIFADTCIPRDRVALLAEELSFFYENHFYRRRLRDQVPSVLEALRERGLRLGVISNTIGRHTMPRNLTAYGIAHFFYPVVTSACVGWRKPNVRIFQEATRALGLPPDACAYVGDTISRDVAGARRAGLGLAIQIKSFLTSRSDRASDTLAPDALVQNLTQVIDLVTGDPLE